MLSYTAEGKKEEEETSSHCFAIIASCDTVFRVRGRRREKGFWVRPLRSFVVGFVPLCNNFSSFVEIVSSAKQLVCTLSWTRCPRGVLLVIFVLRVPSWLAIGQNHCLEIVSFELFDLCLEVEVRSRPVEVCFTTKSTKSCGRARCRKVCSVVLNRSCTDPAMY